MSSACERAVEYDIMFVLEKTRKSGEFVFFNTNGREKLVTESEIAAPDSYVANDEVEVGYGNKIPLWLFGFLY